MYCLLALSTGMRFGEMVGLTRKDLWLCKELTWRIWSTKNDESICVIKVNKFTMDIFEKLFTLTPPNTYQLVFFSQSSKYKVICNANVNKFVNKVLHELKIKKLIYTDYVIPMQASSCTAVNFYGLWTTWTWGCRDNLEDLFTHLGWDKRKRRRRNNFNLWEHACVKVFQNLSFFYRIHSK